MLKVDTSPPLTKPWTKVKALTNAIHLKPLHSPVVASNHHATSTISQSNTRNVVHHQRSLQSQPKLDRLKIFIGTWNMKGRLIDLEPFLSTLQPAATAGSGTTTTKNNNNNIPTLQSDSSTSSNKVLVEHDNNNSGVGGVSPFLDSSSLHPYHLLAIGTQECERDISESLFYPSKEVWEKKLSDYLGNQYKLLRCETLAGVHLAVFVWKHVDTYVKNVHSADIKTGWANMVGNKGAVAVSLDFGSQSLLFINCHLRAHQTKLAERNANIHRILHELQIKGGKATQTQSSNMIFRMYSLKNLTKSSKSIKSAKSTKSTKSAKSAKSTKSTKLKEFSEKVEIPDQQLNLASSSIKPATKDQNQETTGNTKSSKKMTSNRATTSKKGKAPSKPKNTPENSPSANDTNPNKTTPANTLDPNSKRNNGSSEKSSSKTTPSSTATTENQQRQQYSVMEQFNHVFIFGDTNYRLNLTSRQFVLDSIQKQDFKTLLKYDQLTLERQQCTTPLASFKEHPISFIPTYKFDTLETIPTTTESSSSSSSLPVPSSSSSAAAAVNHSKNGQPYYAPSSSSSSSAPSTSVPQTPVTATTTTSSSSSFVITPTDSLYSSNNNSNNGSISIRYDTSPKQRIPSWTDRILWYDREEQKQPPESSDGSNNNGSTTPPVPLPASAPTMTSIATTDPPTVSSSSNYSKPKLHLKWISKTLTWKNKNNGLDRGIVERRPVDKSTICYHYNTVMDPRLMGASDHLPVIGIFGVWFDDWESGAGSLKRTRSIKSIKKKVPRWKKWF